MFNTDGDVAAAIRALGFPWRVPEPDDPTTTPEAIAKDQKEEILRILSTTGVDITSVDFISQEACLPVSVVRRRLAELGRRVPGWKAPRKKPKRVVGHPHFPTARGAVVKASSVGE